MKRSIVLASDGEITCLTGRVVNIEGDVVTIENSVSRKRKAKLSAGFKAGTLSRMHVKIGAVVVMTVWANEELAIYEAGGTCRTGVLKGISIRFSGLYEFKNGRAIFCGVCKNIADGKMDVEAFSYKKNETRTFRVFPGCQLNRRYAFLFDKGSGEVLERYQIV